MKILLFGDKGQIAWELQRALSVPGELAVVGRAEADFERPQDLGAIVAAAHPDVIVNAVAYTAVDRAESEPDRAHTVNAVAVGQLALAAERSGACLIHYSSDYVFDGTAEGRYREDDQTNPMSAYGRSKLAGEQAIIASGCEHLIFRTSWIHAARGANFVRTILRLAGERDHLRVVADQVGAPTSAELVADVTALAVAAKRSRDRRMPSGVYNLTAAGKTTWHQFARFIVTEAVASGFKSRASAAAIEPVPTSGYPLPAPRPSNSLLDTSKLRAALGVVFTDWTYQARRTISDLVERTQT